MFSPSGAFPRDQRRPGCFTGILPAPLGLELWRERGPDLFGLDPGSRGL